MGDTRWEPMMGRLGKRAVRERICSSISAGAILFASSVAIAEPEMQPPSAPPPDAPPQQSEAPQQSVAPQQSATPQQSVAPQRAKTSMDEADDEPIIPEQARSDAPRARAEPHAPFGSQGQWVLMGSSNGFGVSNETFSNSSAKFFDFGAEIGIDTFVIRNLSIGFDLAARYDDNQGYGATTLNETTSTSFSAGARFGVNVPLGSTFSWYPRLTLELNSAHSTTNSLSSSTDAPLPPPSTASSIGPSVNLFAPLLVHPVPHFFVGLGPRLEHDFGVVRGGPYDNSQSTLLSAELVVGGWWGGPAPEGAIPVPPANQAERAFGDQGHLVLTLATAGSISSLTYSNSKGSNTDVNLRPGFDYFVADEISLGVDAFIGHTHGTSLDSTGALTDISSTNVGFAPRIGVNLPLTELLSLWPRVEIGYGTVNTNEASAAGTNQHSRTRSWVELSVPLLVHVSSHFFVGAGPFVFYEPFDTDQYNDDNDATEVGASFILGGWL